jgi:tetratricopeptide (TPR) repeat protein
VILFALYARGAARTIYVGDSGELVAAVHTLGIPHPTGYPLYVLLGKLWTLLVPVGSIAFRMSLMSAACAAAAAAGLYALARRLDLGRVASTFAALLLACSPSFWAEANVQRVYSLNAMFLVAALTAAVKWHHDRKPSAFVATFLLAALGATNHTFMGFFAIAFALFAAASWPSVLRRPRLLAAAAGATVLGLLPYAYLPLRSRMDPALDWANPEGLSGFLDVVLRRGFWQRRWWEGPADIFPIGGDYLRGLGEELYWVGALFAVAGAVLALRRHRARWPIGLLLLVMAANLASMAMHGSRTDLFVWHRYYIPSYAVAALIAGLGCQALVERLPRAARWAPLLLPAAMMVVGFPRHDRSRFRIAEDFSRTLLQTLPPGAHLMASDDNILFVLIYLSLVEGVRPDVDLVMQGAGGSGTPQLRFDPEGDPLYLTHHPNWSLPALDIVPVGLVFRAVRAGSPLPEPNIPKTALDGENDPRVPKDHLTRNLIGDFHYMLGITWEIRDWPRAKEELERASAIAWDNDVLHYNLGLIYWRNGLFDRALAAFEHSHAINPRHLASNDRVRPSDKVAELRTELSRVRRIEAILSLTPGLEAFASAESLSPERHLLLATLLESRGENLAALGHRLRAAEIAAASSSE